MVFIYYHTKIKVCDGKNIYQYYSTLGIGWILNIFKISLSYPKNAINLRNSFLEILVSLHR